MSVSMASIFEPLFVGQVIDRLHVHLADLLQLGIIQLAHRCDLFSPAVGNLIVHGLVRRFTVHVHAGLRKIRDEKGTNPGSKPTQPCPPTY